MHSQQSPGVWECRDERLQLAAPAPCSSLAGGRSQMTWCVDLQEPNSAIALRVPGRGLVVEFVGMGGEIPGHGSAEHFQITKGPCKAAAHQRPG